jgi:PhnB protein
MSRPDPIPAGYGTVTPWIIGHDTAGLMDFLKRAFDAEELSRLADAAGVVAHAEMRIGTSVVMMFDAPRDRPWPQTPAFLRLYLPDADASFDRALAAGATPITRVTHLAFGDRVGRVRDPFGNFWWLQTRVEEVAPDELNRRWSDPHWAEAMLYVQGADFFGPRER